MQKVYVCTPTFTLINIDYLCGMRVIDYFAELH